jgi:hypothetical protein
VLGARRFYHFHHDIEIKGVIHVPVREPLDHAVSWVCYEGSLGTKRTQDQLKNPAESFFAQFEKMLGYRDQAIFYRMEDYPKLKGFGPKRPIRDLLLQKDYGGLRKEIPQFFEWIEEPYVREFYQDYYELGYLE